MNDATVSELNEFTTARDGDALAWRRFVLSIGAAFAVALAASASLIAVSNPYGNLPNTLFKSHVIVQGNQRFQYPAIARTGTFDSLLAGTSTSRILRPARLDEVLGGRFANLAMDSARAWEQYQIAALFRRNVGPKASLIVGLDVVWCDDDAANVRITERGFPKWMYDDILWNDLPHMLNLTALEYGLKRVRAAFGNKAPRVAPDGYKVFLPDEKSYDLAKVRKSVGPWNGDAHPEPQALPSVDASIPAPPALKWLDDLLSLEWERAALVFMPVHVSAQPQAGTRAFRAEESCKARIADLASRHKTPVIDFRIPSPITREVANYWDKLHYRVPVGDEIAGHMATALKTLEDDPAKRWRVLNKGAAKLWP